jgi:hypothetical protein
MNYRILITLFLFVVNVYSCASEKQPSNFEKKRREYLVIQQEFTKLIASRDELGKESLFDTQPQEFLYNLGKSKAKSTN